MKIIITGGLGFIGARLVKNFTDSGDTVTVLDNTIPKNENRVPGSNFVKVDLTKSELTQKIEVGKQDLVIHLAGPSSGPASSKDPLGTIVKSYSSTINVLELAHQCSAKRFLFASSMVVYGNTLSPEKPVEEMSRCEPISHYGIAKFASESLIKSFCEQNGIGYNLLRLFNVYGPGQDLDRKDQGLVSIFIALLLNSPRIEVLGRLDRFRDLVHIDDVVRIFFKLRNQMSYNGPLNVATGKRTELGELIKIIASELNISNGLEIVEGQETPGDINGIIGDINLLKAVTKVSKFVEPDIGVRSFVKWAIQNNK